MRYYKAKPPQLYSKVADCETHAKYTSLYTQSQWVSPTLRSGHSSCFVCFIDLIFVLMVWLDCAIDGIT